MAMKARLIGDHPVKRDRQFLFGNMNWLVEIGAYGRSGHSAAERRSPI
jgi:hypothetical protein